MAVVRYRGKHQRPRRSFNTWLRDLFTEAWS